MFLRDPLPATRIDVKVLFDVELRRLGYATDFVGICNEAAAAVFTTTGRTYACRSRDPARLVDVARAFVHDLTVALRCAGRYDLMIVRDRPIEAAVLFAIARVRRLPTAYWMSFPIPLSDRLTARTHWIRKARARAVLVWVRGRAGALIEHAISLPLADRIFVQSDAMRVALQADGVGAQMSVVPMGVDQTLIQTIAVPAEKREHCVVYIGTLNEARRLDFLIESFALVHKRIPTATLLLIGDGDHHGERAHLEKQVAARGLVRSVQFAGRMVPREALALAARCTIGVSPIPPGPLFDVSSPTKVVEYLALGLPVVVNDIPDQRFVIESSDGGICVPYDVGRFAAAIVELLIDPQRRAACGQRGRDFVLAHRNYRRLAQQLAQDLAPLQRKPSSASTRTATK